MEFGYIRLSTPRDEVEKQVSTFNQPHMVGTKIFVDLDTYDNTLLVSRSKLLDMLEPGDSLHIQSLDILFLSLEEMNTILDLILKKRVTLYCHKEQYILSADDNGNFTELFRKIVRQVSDAMNRINGEVAQSEHENKK